jgi:hypothetical protein
MGSYREVARLSTLAAVTGSLTLLACVSRADLENSDR